MKIPDLSIIEKTLNNEATSEESCEVVRWFKTPEGQAWLAERIDQDEKTIHIKKLKTGANKLEVHVIKNAHFGVVKLLVVVLATHEEREVRVIRR